jgi:hypothetical protein
MAICMDLSSTLAKKYPKQWKEACYNLSGYWKVITNILHSDSFQSLVQLKSKFEAAGFVKMDKKPEEQKLYEDMEPWKDPATLYTLKPSKP